MAPTLNGLCESARMALRVTFRHRAMLPSSPWFAYVGQYGGIVVARADDPESPIPSEWRLVCKVDNSRCDDHNVAKVRDALGALNILGDAQ